MTNFNDATHVKLPGRSGEIPLKHGERTFTVEDIVRTMQYDINNLDHQRTERDGNIIYTFMTRSGSKGADYLIRGGKVVPKADPTVEFPTQTDIDLIASIPQFAEDNLFETLKDPVKIQEYLDYFAEHADEMKAAETDELTRKYIETLEELISDARKLKVYVTDPNNQTGQTAVSTITETAKTFSALVMLAEQDAIANVRAQQAADEDREILATIAAQYEQEA